jgi:outer membrane protein TolC
MSYEGDIIKAKALPNPEGYISFERLIGNNTSGNLSEFHILQPLRLYGQRKYQTNQAEKEFQHQKLNFEAFKNTYTGNLYTLFYEALYNKYLYEIAQEEMKTSKQILDFIKKTYQLGETTKLDLLRGEKDYKFTEVKLNLSKTKYEESVKRLSAFVGFNVKEVEGDINQVRQIKDKDLTTLPQITAINSKIESLENSYKFQKALAKPQISVGFITREQATGKYSAGLMLTFSIPVFYKNLGEIVNIQNQKASFEKLHNYQLENIKQTTAAIKESYNILKSQLEEIDNKVSPDMKAQLSLAEKSYKLRELTLFEYLTIKSQYYELLRYRAELLMQIHKLYGEYIAIVGE